MSPEAPRTSLLARAAAAVFWVVFAYWAVFAVVAPVMTVDSQTYNVARVELASRGGLFGNPLFTSVYQVIYPWSFDALALPFLTLGWGYALPSFLCLAGTCYAVFAMVRPLRGTEAAWAAVLGLLALPCLVYQATSTKTDIPLMFCGAVWLYARGRLRSSGQDRHLLWMVLSLCFMAGSKSTGLLYGAILGVLTLWEVRTSRSRLGWTLLGCAVGMGLFGSVETYAETRRLYGHWLGPHETLALLRNPDGLRGTFANLTRFLAGSLYLGQTTGSTAPAPLWALVRAHGAFLDALGLRDAGVAYNFPDGGRMYFQSGFEELSGFGPVGTLAMAISLVAVFLWRPRALWWRLAAASLAGVLIVSATLAYIAWANRFLIPSYALGTVAVVCWLWERHGRLAGAARVAFVLVAAGFAVAAPLLSFNRGPRDLVGALVRRDALETSADPLIGRLRERLEALHRASPRAHVFVVVKDDTPILPLLEDRQIDAVVLNPWRMDQLVALGLVADGDLEVELVPTRLVQREAIEQLSVPDVYGGAKERTAVINRVVVPGRAAR